jgi:hypothetical protein
VSLPVLGVEARWECPNCTLTDVTHDPRPHSRMHDCAGLKGLTAPMVPAGTKCKVETHEREDYIAGELVRTDGDGRPIMNLITTRDDGTDCVVYAPTATVFSDAHR